MKISVLIPTYHRKKSLLRLLKSLDREKPYEIIIISQGERMGVGKKELFLPQPSLPHARNVGARRAKGDLLLFLDDDVVVRPGIIERYKETFLDPTVAAVSGRVITPGQKLQPRETGVGQVNWLGAVSGGYSSLVPQEIDTVIGCNMCWRRDIYLTLGGIDKKFTGNALREETDLSLRAKALGYRILFAPKADVEHRRAQTGGARKTEGRLQWYFNFFSNETYFFLKHRYSILLPLFLLTKIEWMGRCMFGFGREVSFRSIITPFAGIADGIRKYA